MISRGRAPRSSTSSPALHISQAIPPAAHTPLPASALQTTSRDQLRTARSASQPITHSHADFDESLSMCAAMGWLMGYSSDIAGKKLAGVL